MCEAVFCQGHGAGGARSRLLRTGACKADCHLFRALTEWDASGRHKSCARETLTAGFELFGVSRYSSGRSWRLEPTLAAKTQTWRPL